MQHIASTDTNKRISLVGLIEVLTPFKVGGWAFDRADTAIAPDLALVVDGVTVVRFRPNSKWDKLALRMRLKPHTLGPVLFELDLPAFVADGHPHTIQVCNVHTGEPLPCALPTEVRFLNPQLALEEVPLAWLPTRVRGPAATNKPPLVTVVVLNRNGSGVLNALLESWVKHNSVGAEWVVIDHASTDDSLRMLAGWKTRIPMRVAALKTNHSFSDSCNRGARMARTAHLLFLNNDLIWQHDALPVLLETLAQPHVGIVGMKLLKVGPGPAGIETTEVQHLGVRFAQQASGYWPYETTPADKHAELEHAAQEVPAVTGAALLCRKEDFDATGGFHPDYFYGFEDVEFCLRLGNRLQKKVVCRNDLVALHRHGHTRLTGREPAVMDRLAHNADVLEAHMGLWLKMAWWQSLATGDKHLCVDTLRIGVWVGRLPPPYGMANELTPRFTAMTKLAARLRQQWPDAELILLHDGINAWSARDLHVLVVPDPEFDTRRLQDTRPDLRCVAWVAEQPSLWVSQPWWLDFDAYVTDSLQLGQQVQAISPVAIHHVTRTGPVFDHRVLPSASMTTSWRARVRCAMLYAAQDQPTPECHAAARQVQLALLAEGVPCKWSITTKGQGTELADKDDARPQVHAKSHNLSMAEVCIWIMFTSTVGYKSTSGRKRPLQPSADLPTLSASELNVVWWLTPPPVGHDWPTSTAPDMETTEIPTVAAIQAALEQRIGRTFSSS